MSESALRDVTNASRRLSGLESTAEKKPVGASTEQRVPSPSGQRLTSNGALVPHKEAVATDADSNDGWVSYLPEMYQYFRSVELPIPRSTNNKTGVTAGNRAILVQWIAEIQDAYLRAETWFLIVGIIDRFLAKKDVSLDDLQLVGLGALHIGMKYEESWNFSLLELVDLCAGAYSTNQILTVETEILETLDYRLSFPTSRIFLVQFLNAARKEGMPRHIAASMTTLSSYILDTSLLSYSLNAQYLPSELAAMSVYLARKGIMLSSLSSKSWPGPLWPHTMQHHTGCSQQKLEQMAVALAREKSAIDGWGLNAPKKKYGRGFASCEKLLHRALASVQLMEFPLI